MGEALHWLAHLLLAGVSFLGLYVARKAMDREAEALEVNQRARGLAHAIWEAGFDESDEFRSPYEEGRSDAADEILAALRAEPSSAEHTPAAARSEDEIPW